MAEGSDFQMYVIYVLLSQPPKLQRFGVKGRPSGSGSEVHGYGFRV